MNAKPFGTLALAVALGVSFALPAALASASYAPDANPPGAVQPAATATPVSASGSGTGADDLCTFTAARHINLRSGPGTRYQIVGTLRAGERVTVTGLEDAPDGYVWWEVGDNWVRSDLGASDCPAVCGDRVCASSESAETCARDCRPARASSGCIAEDCQACYETIPCYPECNQCTCSKNAYGCPVCYCTYPESASTDATRTPGGGCVVNSCQACYESIYCYPACNQCTCSTNEYGCAECYCAYPSGSQ